MSSAPDLTSRILRHESALVTCSLALLVAFCWWFLLAGAGMHDGGMTGMAMPPPLPALVVMWWLMMVAMMLPSAAPAILLYARVRTQRNDGTIAQTGVFTLGYLLTWLAFSVVAALVHREAAVADMRLVSDRAAGVVLILAGCYQLSPFKTACLRQCRSPAQFLARHWRAGTAGAIRLGALHGAFCVGCCWMLMALLLVGGVMNFAWIALLTVAVAIEKLLPGGEWLGRAAGILLTAWGGILLLG